MLAKDSRHIVSAVGPERMSRLGLSEEAMGFVDGMDRYEMVEDNPINREDPTGLESASFGDIVPTTGPSTAPATAPATSPSFLRPAPQSKSLNVTLTNGDKGTLVVTWDKVYAPGAALGRTWPGVKVTFEFKPDKDAKGCGANLTWYQTIHSTVDNAPSLDSKKLVDAIAKDTAEHQSNPFDKTIGDNPTGDPTKPYPSTLQTTSLIDDKNKTGPYGSTMHDAPSLPSFWPAGAIVTKNFVSTLTAGASDKPVGLSIEWHTTQTAGDATKTTILGTVTWGK